MSVWKILLIMLMGASCLALGLGTIIVPFSMAESGQGWLWFVGMLLGTMVMSTLLIMFLMREDRSFTVGGQRARR